MNFRTNLNAKQFVTHNATRLIAGTCVAVASLAMTGCTNQTEGDRTLERAETIEQAGTMIKRGEAMVVQGKATEAEGKALRDQGRMDDGNRLINQGQAEQRQGQALIDQGRSMK
jgi:hypothetical protein